LNFPPISEHLCSRGFVEFYPSEMKIKQDQKAFSP
jgi:hypothetical protein